MQVDHEPILVTYSAGETVRLPDGRLCSGPNCEGDAARLLISSGANPTTPITFLRDGVPALRGSLRAFVSRAWGGSTEDPAFRRWRPARLRNGARVQGLEPQDGAEGFGGIIAPEAGDSLYGGAA
ncbi:hypothetical protein ACQW02_27795 [Humitalea sp. 24SJ18S-53]|uniref:hypothetical protein n=1 Tax=Humitalea sp. 24SJ18S-53 TaxID=3422307 RepID=UPI003D6798E6